MCYSQMAWWMVELFFQKASILSEFLTFQSNLFHSIDVEGKKCSWKSRVSHTNIVVEESTSVILGIVSPWRNLLLRRLFLKLHYTKWFPFFVKTTYWKFGWFDKHSLYQKLFFKRLLHQYRITQLLKQKNTEKLFMGEFNFKD